MLKRTAVVGTSAAVVAAATLGLAPATANAAAAPHAAAAQQAPRATATSSINQVIPGVGTFVGSFTPTSFGSQNGQLSVTGLVTGTLTTLTGAVVPVSQTVTTSVQAAQASGSCKILDLVLGPLHLDLLGLVVDLNQVHLQVTAQQGPGNLLGNLLCAVAGLLDGNGLNGLANRLNNLLGL